MNQTLSSRFAGRSIALFCLALAACGGSEGDAVETFGLQFKANTPIASIDASPFGVGGPSCRNAYVGFEIENRDGAALPIDLAIERVAISNADGSVTWPLSVRDFEISSLQPPRRRVVAERCALSALVGRVIPFPTFSLVTVTVELKAGGMHGRLQAHRIYLGQDV